MLLSQSEADLWNMLLVVTHSAMQVKTRHDGLCQCKENKTCGVKNKNSNASADTNPGDHPGWHRGSALFPVNTRNDMCRLAGTPFPFFFA
jgi:hypothetical protein